MSLKPMKPLMYNGKPVTKTIPDRQFVIPPFEHKIVYEGKVDGEGEDIRFVEPTGRGMRGIKYLKWLEDEFGGLEFALSNRVFMGLDASNKTLEHMFGTKKGYIEEPYTYKIGFVEFKPSDKSSSFVRSPFMFLPEGSEVYIPSRDRSVSLSRLGFSVVVNALSTNMLTWMLVKEFDKNEYVYNFSIGRIDKDDIMKWDNLLRLIAPYGIGDMEESSKIWSILD